MFEPKVKKMSWFVTFITFGWAAGITLAPFGIYVKENYLDNIFTINHEKIHWKQQLEMLIIFFYIWYLIEWVIKLFMNKNAYKSISFEREAYKYGHDLLYLKKRKSFAWFGYIKKKK